MLPGEAGAAEDLDGVLGAGVRGLRCGGGGEGGGEPTRPVPGLLVGGAGGVPGEGAGLFEADEHVGAEVLDRLERPDGPPELLPHAGVFDGRAQTAGGGPAGVGGEEDGGQVADEGGCEGQGPVGRYGDGVGPHLCRGPGGVDAAVRAHGEPFRPGVHEEPALAGGGGGGEEQQVGGVGGEGGRGGAVEAVAGRGGGGGEGAGGEGEGGGTFPGGDGPERVAGRGAGGACQHRAHEYGREVRAGQRAVGRLLQDHREVQDSAAPAPVLLGQLDAGQPLCGERRPVLGARSGCGRGRCVEECAGLAGRDGPGEPPAYGAGQCAVFLGDADAGSRTGRRTAVRADAHGFPAGRSHWNGARVEHVSPRRNPRARCGTGRFSRRARPAGAGPPSGARPARGGRSRPARRTDTDCRGW